MKTITVAVDGPAGSGKSSVSKKAAMQTGFKYIDSGALYRSVTLFFLERYPGGLDVSIDFTSPLLEIDISQVFDAEGRVTSFLNGRDVSALIRDERITANIGIVSDRVPVREYVNSLLRLWAEKESVIMDGRDIGTVVFPGAELKIYLDASVEIRAKRRIDEYKQMGKYLDENAVKNQIILRDNQDMNRSFGRLARAEGAVVIDTSDMTFSEVVDRIVGLIREYR
jgi:cytidylate kinase